LQNFAILSGPAFVLESDAKIMPSSSLIPTQYVTLTALRRVAWSAARRLKLECLR